MDLYLAYGLILIGLLLMAAELFVPSFGVLFVLSVTAMIAGIAMTFQGSPLRGLITLAAVFVLTPIAANILLQWLPRTPLGRKYFLTGTDEDATVASMPVNLELEQLRGRYGKTVSALRPAGITDFDGRRVDTMSEGTMIAAGQWVKCIDVKSGKVIVRQVDRPPDLASLETGEFKP
jgi:membrane-bound serine protease (ClpP class)